MTMDSAVDLSTIQRHAASRARELGGAPRAADVEICWAGFETPAGVSLFRATWIDRSGWRALSGACMDGSIESRPLEVIALLFKRWCETEGHLPDAATAAAACAFVLDAEARHRLLLASPDPWPDSTPTVIRRQVHQPGYLGGEQQLPLVFWWLDERARLIRVEIGRRYDGRISFEAAATAPGVECP